MPYNETLVERVREALAAVSRVEEKKIFGGLAFMVHGKMCITVGKDRIMCRIDPEIHEEAIHQKGVRTVSMGGREYIGYVHVDEKALRSKRQFEYWINLALSFNKKAKPFRKKRKIHTLSNKG